MAFDPEVHAGFLQLLKAMLVGGFDQDKDEGKNEGNSSYKLKHEFFTKSGA